MLEKVNFGTQPLGCIELQFLTRICNLMSLFIRY